MRLSLELAGGTVEFTQVDDGPYPYLTSVGTLRIAARAGTLAGLGVGESPSVAVALDNTERQVAAIIGNPLRGIATITYDDGEPFFAGAVSNITFGRSIDLVVTA